ncbi:MAG: hypothetical protein AB7D51_08765 [Desulfovibrionaceae bacterium]
MRLHDETAGTRPAPAPRPHDADITALREHANALLAGSRSMRSAPVFELRRQDARRYHLLLEGARRELVLTRPNGAGLALRRDITLPAGRPVVLLVEHGEDFSEADLAGLAALTGHGPGAEAAPRLCAGSLVLCGALPPRWA